MLSVVADGPKSLGDLSPLPWMRSYISNSKLVALISMTFCSQLDCSANRDSSVFDVKLELRREEKVDSSVDKWDSWRTWGEASATQPEKNSGDVAPWRQEPAGVQQEATKEENEERIVPRHERSALGQRPVFAGAAPISPGNSLHWQSERSQSSREPRRAVGTQNDRRGYRQQRHANIT